MLKIRLLVLLGVFPAFIFAQQQAQIDCLAKLLTKASTQGIKKVTGYASQARLLSEMLKYPRGEDNEISVMIEDNGIGFDQSSKDFSNGIGLKNIQIRIEYLKGTVDISSEPGKGTLVALYVPLES
ncbi:sensor histidine kinase [Pedobacter sp. JCM 36344]|uniref:sensor histidine kinase n=1 Tax=Pedobacter sp. JCM 36344 TaxID=3374280 RepID=UPI003978B31A